MLGFRLFFIGIVKNPVIVGRTLCDEVKIR